MPNLDRAQLKFCESKADNIRLLAPAGCGKTSSLLYRCRELALKAKSKPRFLIVTFTVAATNELKERLANDPEFDQLRDQCNITTLNAYGWNRIRAQANSPQLLNTNDKRYFAMRNQLRPMWHGNPHLESVISKPGNGARTLMTVMDNMKSMGFARTRRHVQPTPVLRGVVELQPFRNRGNSVQIVQDHPQPGSPDIIWWASPMVRRWVSQARRLRVPSRRYS